MQARKQVKVRKPTNKSPKAVEKRIGRGKGGKVKARDPQRVGGKSWGPGSKEKSKPGIVAEKRMGSEAQFVDLRSPVSSTSVLPKSVSLRLDAVCREFTVEQPPPGIWGEWMEVKAEKYGLTTDQIEHRLERLTQGYVAEARATLNAEARSLGNAWGNLRKRAIKVYVEGMEATKEIGGGIRPDGKIILPISVVDHNLRIKAADRVMQIYGMSAPSKVEHEVEVGDKYAAMGTLDMAQRLIGMLGDLGFGKHEDGKLVIDVKAEEVADAK